MRWLLIGLLVIAVVGAMGGFWKRSSAQAQPAPQVGPMTAERAQALMRYWQGSHPKSSGPDALGLFIGQGGGAFFRYDAEKQVLLVSGLVRYDVSIMAEFPELWEDLLRAGKREHKAMGEGAFELFGHPVYHLKRDVVLLTKPFDGAAITDEQFVAEVRWLLQAAHYWRMKRYNDVAEKPEDALAKEADAVNATWPKRPW